MALADLRGVLSVQRFRQLFAVRLLGQSADGLLQAALATFVLFSPERQTTAAQVAGAFAVLLLPYSAVGPFVGVFLDRWSRQRVLLVANLLRAIGFCAVAAVVAAGHNGLWLALLVLVVLGINRFVLAALSASLPHVVAGERLVTANALVPTSGTLAAAAAALVGIGLRAALGGGDRGSVIVILIAAAICVCAGLTAARLPRRLLGPDPDGPPDPGVEPGDRSIRDVLRGLVAGVRHLRAHPGAARAIGVVVAHRIVFGALVVDALLLLRNTLGDPDNPDGALAAFAVVTGVAAAAAGCAAIATPWATRRWGIPRWTAGVLTVGGVATIVGLLPTSYAGMWVAAAGVGFAGQAVKVCSDTVVQRDIDDAHRGRVFSLYDVAVNIGLVSGITAMAIAAPASGVAPVPQVVAGVILLMTAAWVLRRR